MHYDKKKDSELHLIASLPKPQSLPAHQLFKDKRKVYQVYKIDVVCWFLLISGLLLGGSDLQLILVSFYTVTIVSCIL